MPIGERDSGPALRLENPMIRSGLALAGANVSVADRNDIFSSVLVMSSLDYTR
ncbi:MAG: hypothetical protein HQK89_02790 [Nitrospirae bacterium]|nr:hypothetical protein [Nitrospirota bacterium]